MKATCSRSTRSESSPFSSWVQTRIPPCRWEEVAPRFGHLRRPASSRDRKSTRLNSSHLGISYAVFCLKKKIHVDLPREQHLRAGVGERRPVGQTAGKRGRGGREVLV